MQIKLIKIIKWKVGLVKLPIMKTIMRFLRLNLRKYNFLFINRPINNLNSYFNKDF